LAVVQRQSDEFRSQLNQATDQLRSSQARITALEAELNQRPSRDDLTSAQRKADELRSQLKQAADQLSSSQVRISGLEGELEENKRAAQLALVNRGDALLSSGDIASARLFYERAAEAGNAKGALRLGESYDPGFLKRAQLQMKPDSAQARFWYGRARELGASEADILLKAIQTD
jgi:TPR repeat protein